MNSAPPEFFKISAFFSLRYLRCFGSKERFSVVQSNESSQVLRADGFSLPKTNLLAGISKESSVNTGSESSCAPFIRGRRASEVVGGSQENQRFGWAAHTQGL